MDAFVYFLLLLVSVASALPMVEEVSATIANESTETTTDAAATDVTSTDVIATADVTTTVSSPTLNMSCVTARNATGSCVVRASCGYGTSAIDRTLYAPRGYVKPCQQEEVCCPTEFIVTETPSHNSVVDENDAAFGFDDDD